MPLWGPNDQANNAPNYGADLVNAGSGNAGKSANTQAMYNNTTANLWIPNETDSLVYVTPYMITTGKLNVSGGPGWYYKRQGSGGRAGRVSYEALSAYSASGALNASYTYNLKRTNTSRVRAVYQANTRSTIIALSGDSTMRGVDETASPYNTQYGVAPPMQLASIFNGLGINAGCNNLYGWCGTSMADFTTRDGRVSVTGATATGSNPCLGGAEFAMGAAGTLSFTPQGNTTKADIYFKDAAAGVQFSWSVDGGGETTVSTLNNNSIRKITVSLGASGAHTIRITWIAGNVRIYGIDCYDDTAGRKEITFRQWAISGATASAFVDDTFAPSAGRIAMLSVSTPDLVISECGVINSWRNSTSVATVKSQLIQYVQAVKAVGSDFMFISPAYDNGVAGLTASQDQYVTAMYEVATQLDVPLIDLRKRWVSYANAVAKGWQVGSDAVHPTKNGYIDMASNALFKPIQFALAA